MGFHFPGPPCGTSEKGVSINVGPMSTNGTNIAHKIDIGKTLKFRFGGTTEMDLNYNIITTRKINKLY